MTYISSHKAPKQSTAKPAAKVSLPPITVPAYVRDRIRAEAQEQERDLTKQVRKILTDYANDGMIPAK